MISPLSSHNLLTPTCELTAACSQQVVPAVYTIGRVWDGLIGKTLPCHLSAVNINMTGHQFYTLSRVWQKKKPHLSEFDGNGGARGRAWLMFTQSRRTAVYNSWSPRPRVHKENESASLLIPSAGRDKLSPLMKSFRRLHAGSVCLCLCVCWEGLSMWTAHTLKCY